MECKDIQHKFLIDAVRQFLEASPYVFDSKGCSEKQAATDYLKRAYEACK